MLKHNLQDWSSVGRRRRRSPRRGMAVLLVILLLSVTLGISYAMVRSQNMSVEIERNADRRDQARQAAMTGLAVAMKKMQTSAWAGVGTTLSGTLSSSQQYSTTFTVGDASLTSGSADYKEYPYRVTLDAVGQATDPANSQRISSCTLRAVVRLVPRALPSEPTSWATITQNYTIYGNGWGGFSVDVPTRTVGKIRCGGVLDLCSSYNWSSTARDRYIADLATMVSAGVGDYRPFTGPVELPSFLQSSTTTNILSSLGVTRTNQWPSTTYFSAALDSQMHYQLYPGGKTYTATSVAATLQGVTLAADPQTNPLGLFVRFGDVTLGDNVTVQGTLLALGYGTVNVQGRNIQLTAPDLPPLYGSTQPVQHPAVIADNDVRFQQNSGGAITGLVVVGNQFEVVADNQADISATVNGRIIAQYFNVRDRSEWWQTSTWWTTCYNTFMAQKGNVNGIKYFPAWLKTAAAPQLDYVPRVVIQPDARSIQYHWKNSYDQTYVAATGDGGLRWELLSWTILP